MVVDDDASVLAMLERLLAFWGYDTLPIGTFEEARRALGEHLPDALVTDVRLGDYNGLQLVHLIKRRNPTAVVIAVSGIDDPVLRQEAANAGAAYLLKPTELSLLRDHLSRGIRGQDE
jgi:DNA-binding response OmpR family regulator